MRRLLFDLFGLFMKAQNESGMAGIHEAARIRELGIDPHEFDLAYRELRDPLDANTQDFEQYMAAMGERLGANFCAIPGLVEATEQADVDSWSAHHPDMVAWLEHMHRDGQAPAVLSNIPRTHLGWVRENKPWITLFEPAFFSCDLGLAKPDHAIYHHAINHLGGTGHDILFFDDTYANVVGAREAGLRAVHFTGIEQAQRDVAAFLAGADLGRE